MNEQRPSGPAKNAGGDKGDRGGQTKKELEESDDGSFFFPLLTPAAIPRGETMGRRIMRCQTAVSAFPLEPAAMTSDAALLFKSWLPRI